MANPLDPLRQLADPADLATTPTDDLYDLDRNIKEAIEAIPNLQHQLAEKRRAIARELRHNRQQSWGKMAAGYGVSRTRAIQMVEGSSANAGQRRARKTAAEDDS
ncbi:hypothetical protein ACIBCR_15380 [Micromonospora echinospora]|uniref:hypothetical protein n=1 Tax=Micromonospora echinospora TaxID=1877 RepID=UPI00379C50CA